MTRINIGVEVEKLCDVHLLSEHRECVRIPNLVSKGKYDLKSQPAKFTLGKGHVAYFYTRLGYLLNRYKQLYKECKDRGFNVQDYSSAWDNVPSNLMKDYTPTFEDKCIVQMRINDRLKTMKNTKISPKILA